TVGDGIIRLPETELDALQEHFEASVSKGTRLLKFVPASGAASRMFKFLYEAREKLRQGIPETKLRQEQEINAFLNKLKCFSFYEALHKLAGKMPEQIPPAELLDLLLTEKGLNYGNLPKGLLLFHRYRAEVRTPFEEHCMEGARYAKNHDRSLHIHFTVSSEHLGNFTAQLEENREHWSRQTDALLDISFSQQKSSTDTIAATPENEPFRNADGSLLFRPGGHGALLANLNELDADVIFIKNIDNVQPDCRKTSTVIYKKALAGLLLRIQQKIFSYQQVFASQHYYSLNSAFLSEAAGFLENILHVQPPGNLYYTEKEHLYHYLKAKFDRPLRVCGMVANQGEPGGGPFWTCNSDGSVSLQIVESAQVNLHDPDQKECMSRSTHFNPVDLVCGVRNYKGEKYDLNRFRDPKTGFITRKSKDGRVLKAQELPGLWNGAMAHWNTLFVEVPVETFSPVKTVNDLLRKEHQPA
ncbi:MAG: DUF4301 family protein, partial [Mangrovibacterium sp.]